LRSFSSMVLGLSPAACYQLFKYGGPEIGPKNTLTFALSQLYPLSKRVVLWT
jgi:hypothetical protein